jgi:drug/metabolite transporter (DMT)-like permease
MALGSAALYDTGYVLEKQALSTLPPVPVGLVGLVRTVRESPRWLAGFVAMLGGLALQLLAYTLAPLPLVQPVLAAGVVALVLISRWVLGERLGRRESASAALVLVALVAIAVSSEASDEVARSVLVGQFVAAVAPVFVVAGIVAWAGRRHILRDYRGLALLGAAAGLLYGVSALAEKAVATQIVQSGVVSGGLGSLATAYPWLFVAAVAGGLVVLQVGLQRHLASLVVPLTNVIGGAFVLAAAAPVFGERLVPSGWWAFPRLLGFAAVIGAVYVLCARPSAAVPVREPAPALANAGVADRDVLVVVPALNEERTVAGVVRRVRACLPLAGVLVVDDGSADATAVLAGAAGADVAICPFTLGVGGAMRIGFRYADRHGYRAVVQVDGDGQHEPDDLPRLLAALDSGPRPHVVIGSRFAPGRPDGNGFVVPGPRRLAMRSLAGYVSWRTGTRLDDVTSGFRAHNRAAVELFARRYPTEYLSDTVESLVIAHAAGARLAQIPVRMHAREAGRPSHSTLQSIAYLGRVAVVLVLGLARAGAERPAPALLGADGPSPVPDGEEGVEGARCPVST